MNGLVSIIIPIWDHTLNKPHSLKMLLDSIRQHVSLNYEVIVVCNSTNPRLVDFVKSHSLIKKYCLNSTNVGVSRGWNMGSHMAEGDIFCYINDDVLIGKGCLEGLSAVLMSSNVIGEVGVEGSNWEVTSNKARYTARINSGKFRECDAISGFLFMIKKEAYIEVGGFDDSFTPAWFEEIDISFKIRSAGYKCYVVPGLNYEHQWGISTTNRWRSISYLGKSERAKKITKKHHAYFVRKWYGRISSSSRVELKEEDEIWEQQANRGPIHELFLDLKDALKYSIECIAGSLQRLLR